MEKKLTKDEFIEYFKKEGFELYKTEGLKKQIDSLPVSPNVSKVEDEEKELLFRKLYDELINAGRDMEQRDNLNLYYLPKDAHYDVIKKVYLTLITPSERKTSERVEEIIKYIESDAEIQIPIDRFFNEDKTHITKKEYGKVLIEILCNELREKFNVPYFELKKNISEEGIIINTKLEFYRKLEHKIDLVLNGEIDLQNWANEVSNKIEVLENQSDSLPSSPPIEKQISEVEAVEFAEWIAKSGIKESAAAGMWLIMKEGSDVDIEKRVNSAELFTIYKNRK